MFEILSLKRTKHFFWGAQGDEEEEDKRGCLCPASRETELNLKYVHETSQNHLLFCIFISLEIDLKFWFARNQTPTATAQVKQPH